MTDQERTKLQEETNEVSEKYLWQQKVEADHREWAVSSLADYLLLFATRDDFQTPGDYVRVIHDFQCKALPIIEESIKMTLDIIMGSEDLDNE